MELNTFVRPNLVFPQLEGGGGKDALRSLATKVAETGVVSDSERLYEKLMEREGLGSTAMGGGVAIPHCKLPGIEEVVVAVGLVPEGVDLGAPDEEAVTVIFLVISPPDSPAQHLKCLAALSQWIRHDHNVDKLKTSRSSEEICQFLQAESAG